MGIEQKITNKTKPKLKKYLFLISILFFILTGFHLLYQYIYSDAEMYPIEWWTVSEGLIGNFPSLNPLKPLSGNNGYFMNLLYRSMLTYDQTWDKVSENITKCDHSNLSYIECYIQDDIKWSNWNNITIEDITATYNLLKNSDINLVIASLLEWTTITSTDNSIIFKKPDNKDINFLNIFFQPILPIDTINSIWKENLNGNFSTIGQIYSWKFKITNVQQDLSLWITKFILEKNIHYKDNLVLIDQLIIKLFPDTNTFNKNKETINIFQDNNNLIWSSLPRFDVNEYLLPQYVSVFLNKETLPDSDFRNTILNKISRENLLKHIWSDNITEVYNPYMTEYSIEKSIQNKNYENIISKYGYEKKSKLIQEILPEQKPDSFYSAEVKHEELPEILSLDIFQKNSDVITVPEYVDKYNSISKDDILLTWIAQKGVDAVYINDYKLQWFKKWNTNFHYRLRESYWTIQTWINKYKIYFEKNWKKEFIEEIIFIFNTDEAKLKRDEDTLLEELYKEKIKQEKEKAISEENNKPEVNKDSLKKLSELDDTFYYNDNYDKLTLDLFYVASDRNIEKSALFIKNTLEEIWIYIELHPISITWLSNVLARQDEYDIILAGIDLGYFSHNIFPYFHSSQVKNWYNFSNIKKALLDNNLKDLKESFKNKDKRELIQVKVLDILKEEQVVKTLYSPKQKLIVDKNINIYPLPLRLQSKNMRTILYDKLYTNEKRVINIDWKNIFWFFKYIIEIL